MKIGSMKESKYLKKEDVGQGKTATIDRLDKADVSLENEPEEIKYTMYFKEILAEDGKNKPLVLNWTNIQLCAIATGTDETDEWPGKQIVLYHDPNVSFAGQLKGGIRIRTVQQPDNPVDSRTPPVEAYEANQ